MHLCQYRANFKFKFCSIDIRIYLQSICVISVWIGSILLPFFIFCLFYDKICIMDLWMLEVSKFYRHKGVYALFACHIEFHTGHNAFRSKRIEQTIYRYSNMYYIYLRKCWKCFKPHEIFPVLQSNKKEDTIIHLFWMFSFIVTTHMTSNCIPTACLLENEVSRLARFEK